ncbi:MAG: hypothetical protein ABWW70_00995 [Thermoproteota archaeon]
MARITLVVHPTCASSYRVVKHLDERGLLGRVELVVADKPSAAFRYRAWSVPWVLVDGEPAASDPVSPEELERIIVEGKAGAPGSVEEAFMEAVLHSAYASSLALLWGSLEPVLDRDLASAALRSPLTGVKPEEALQRVGAEAERLYGEWSDKMARALGISFVREAWWALRGKLTAEALRDMATPAAVGAWLLAKASIGRIGLPSRPLLREGPAEAIARFVRAAARGLLNKIEREQREILEDGRYWSILDTA